tara:strand:+ start:7683 stop:8687 length:1005 start_codon:yes stop_codon:yes gene_type:complete
MTKFIDKKEQVFDLKLTTYGHHLLSAGKFKPIYYAFCDDNVIYDSQYAGVFERQNEAHNRIKNNTPYLESLVLFQDVEDFVSDESTGEINFFSNDVTPIQKIPRKDVYRYGARIGDGHISGEPQKAPAWKVVTLQGNITSSSGRDDQNNVDIPQINLDITYKKKIIDSFINVSPTDIRDLDNQTMQFVDGKTMSLIPENLIFYLEEVNTELLMENFDIEVYEVVTGSDDKGTLTTQLERKYFKTQKPQIVDGLLVFERPVESDQTNVLETTDYIDYYFDVMTDSQIDQTLACKGSEYFNKESYYINLDFQCAKEDVEDLFYDIYGAETEPEICQ